MTMAVIDLGDVSDPSAGPDDYPGGGRRREFDRATIGRLIRGAIALVAVLALGGSGLPGRPVLHEVWSTAFSEMDAVTVLGESVFLFRAVPGGESELTAHDLATGTTRWTRRTPGDPIWVNTLPRAGLLLLPTGEELVERTLPDGGIVQYVHGGTLTALDPATGEQLWKYDGMHADGETGDSLLLFERAEDSRLTTLRLIGSRSGSVIWERAVPPGAETVTVLSEGDAPSLVVTASDEGELTTMAYSDGRTLTSGRVPWTPVSMNSGEGSQLTTAGGRILIVDNGSQQSEVTAYHPDNLRRLWSKVMPGWAYAETCGPLICLGAAGNFTTAVDPSDGGQRWDFLGSAYPSMPVGAGRLLLTTGDTIPRQTIVDIATGRQIGPSIPGYVTSRDQRTGSLMLLQGLYPDLTRNAVSRLDPATGRVTTLGAVTVTQGRFCDGGGRYLVCLNNGRMVVTAVG
jgi:outer membrane protein assembly factor BamB